MGLDLQFLYSSTAERMLVEAGGIACMYWGYRLFTKGVIDKESMEAAKGDIKIKLVNAAPGTFFALFGAIVLIIALMKAPSLSNGPTVIEGLPAVPRTNTH